MTCPLFLLGKIDKNKNRFGRFIIENTAIFKNFETSQTASRNVFIRVFRSCDSCTMHNPRRLYILNLGVYTGFFILVNEWCVFFFAQTNIHCFMAQYWSKSRKQTYIVLNNVYSDWITWQECKTAFLYLQCPS